MSQSEDEEGCGNEDVGTMKGDDVVVVKKVGKDMEDGNEDREKEVGENEGVALKKNIGEGKGERVGQ